MPFSYLTVIVNYNDAQLTSKCVHSLLSAGAAPRNILVINNGSGETGADPYSANPSSIRMMNIAENRGYAAALNAGIRTGQEEGVEWYILLNNDIEVEPEFLGEVEKAIGLNPGHFIFGPKIVYRDDPSKIWFFREKQIAGTILTINLDKGRQRAQPFADVVSTDSLSGSAMIINACVFPATGLFDESYFLYSEEVDFLWQAKKEGFTLAATNRAVVRHAISASTSKTGKSAYYRFRNQSWFYRRNSSRASWPFLLVFTLTKALVSSLRHNRDENPEPGFSRLAGWKAGWFSPLDGR